MKKSFLFLNLIFLVLLVNAQGPKFEWAKSFNTTINYTCTYCNYVSSLCLDKLNNVYTVGTISNSTDLDPGEKTFMLYSDSGYRNMFISKLSNNGNFVWAKNFEGYGEAIPFSIVSDKFGNTYTTGSFIGTVDFDPGLDTFNLSSLTWSPIFILKLDEFGNFKWAKQIESKASASHSIALDEFGNIYTTGFYRGTVDFDPGPNLFEITSNGDSDIFLTKLDSSGNFIWAKSFGGLSEDNGYSIKIDALGKIHVLGSFNDSVDFDPNAGVFYLTSQDNYDIFILKLDMEGNFLWVKQMGGTSNAWARFMSIDRHGNIYSTGGFDGTADFDPGPIFYSLTSGGNFNTFISKLDSSGNFVWAKNLGLGFGNCLAIDSLEFIYTIGNFYHKADFDPGPDTYYLTPFGENDVFLSKLDASGNFVWAKHIGGQRNDFGKALAVDAGGNIYSTGHFNGTADFDLGEKSYIINNKYNNADIFILKIRQSQGNGYRNGLLIYPNPTSDFLYIDLENLKDPDLKIQILNSIGQIVKEETGTTNSPFNIQHLLEGLYLVRVISDNQIVATQKIIKQ